MGLEKSHFRTLNRALAKLKNISSEKLLETDRKIESYIRCLNSNDQYGILLYDTGEIIVPECEEGHYKLCSLQTRPNPVFCSRDEGKTTFWDGLPEIESINQNKTVLFTFEAVRVSVEAFKYSFPVICLDGCFLKCPGYTAQLFTASFMTTENHLLPMCFGTAPTESLKSWNSFLANHGI